jgi:hypothetical protein
MKAAAVEGRTLDATSCIPCTTTVLNKTALRLAEERPIIKDNVSAFDVPDTLAATETESDTSPAARRHFAIPLKTCGVSHDSELAFALQQPKSLREYQRYSTLEPFRSAYQLHYPKYPCCRNLTFPKIKTTIFSSSFCLPYLYQGPKKYATPSSPS